MSVFNTVKTPKLPRAKFNLSHEMKLDGDMGQLYPVCLMECVPNDYFKISEECVIRTLPLVAPVLQEINAYVHYFFVPYRLLVDDEEDWTTFFTGGKDGLEVAPPLPRWNPTTSTGAGANGLPHGSAKYSLWDYCGFPTGLKNFSSNGAPLAFPKRAYNLIWNNFYRDCNLQDEISLDEDTIQFRNVSKDYFTSALPFIVRGVMPSIPIAGGTVSLNKSYVQYDTTYRNTSVSNSLYIPSTVANGNAGGTEKAQATLYAGGGTSGTLPATGKPLYVQPSGSVTVDANISVDDLRLLFAQERWLMASANTGCRYDEFLIAHYGIAPRNDVLDKPEYIGGVKMPMIVSEVAQTSSTNSGDSDSTPQGNLTGSGLTANGQYVGSYHAKEFGVIVGILSVLPKQSYMNGIDRAWLKEDRFDFYTPEFASLDSQPIWNEEIYAKADSSFNSADIFGYQGRFDELRYIPSKVCGGMRDIYSTWHLARKFSSLPRLSSGFVSAKYYSTAEGKRIFSVVDDDFTNLNAQRGLIINYRNVVSAVRPLPYLPN